MQEPSSSWCTLLVFRAGSLCLYTSTYLTGKSDSGFMKEIYFKQMRS